NEFFIFPSDVDSEAEVLKAKFADAVDKLSTLVKKRIDDGRGIKSMELMMESAKRAAIKRLTLRSHEEEERLREEECKRKEEEARLLEEDKQIKEEEEKRKREEETNRLKEDRLRQEESER
ncbi:hypothetical protein A2U01_0061155, partial [Trifolium medium]|nr:hypothetical protein [Trifolium medium]